MEPCLQNQKDQQGQEAAESTVNRSKFVLPVLALFEGQGKASGLAISRILDEVAVLQWFVFTRWKSIYNSSTWLQHLEKKSLFHYFYGPWWLGSKCHEFWDLWGESNWTLHWLPVFWISGEFHLSGHLLHHNSCWIFYRQQTKNSVYRSRQSLNSPSPGETEMDLLVTRERPRRGIRNSGYDVSLCWATLLFPWVSHMFQFSL